MLQPWESVLRHSYYTFYDVKTLFDLLDDLDANRDTYYAAICASKNGRHYVHPKVSKEHISQLNTGDTAIDLLRWVAYLNDWPFYIERFKTQFYRKGPKRSKNHTRILNRITLCMRPLSWFGVEVTAPARHFNASFTAARADYKRLLGGAFEVEHVRLNTRSDEFHWCTAAGVSLTKVNVIV